MATSNDKIPIFKYVPELDCFVADDSYRRIADYLGLAEWNHVVWIGRLFTSDNDFGEHWFDNWDERTALEEQALALGYDSQDLLIVAPSKMHDGKDGPCHTDDFRRRFWTEVLSSMKLSLGLIFDEARHQNALLGRVNCPNVIQDLEARIQQVLAEAIPPL